MSDDNSLESFDAFISYKWDQHKSNVHFLADYLEKRNLKIWLDRDKLKESDDLSITMKNGIDQSELFICCVTDNYCDFEDAKNKNCKSEFNYAFSTNKKILYIIFTDVQGLGEAEIIRRFNAVGFRMSGNLFYKYNQSNLDQILHAIHQKKRKITKTPLNNYLPNHADEYVKKTDLEKKIGDLFVKTNVVTISGSSGMGKTSLALNYAREMANNKLKIVRFINSKDKDSIYDSLSKILDSFTGMQKRFTKFTEIELIENLIFYLKKYKAEYLFIIDNLNDFDDLKILMEKTPTNVKYLITTQIEVNEEHDFGSINMTDFNIAETNDYMIKNLKRKDRTKENCSKLAKVIFETTSNKGIIPIYLVQLVQYLNRNKEINLRDFITNFKEENFDIMHESLEKIREENKRLWSLLKFASILDGSFIHYKLLKMYLNIKPGDKQTLSVLISTAQQNSLLIDDYDEENEYGVRIHELIQKGIQNKSKSLSKKINKMANTINVYYEETETYPDYSWINSIYSISHAKKILENKQLKDKQIRISLNRKIALSHINKKQQIQEGIRYCLNANEIETDEKRKSLLDLIIGNGYESIGNFNKAIQYYNRSLEKKLELYNHDDPSIGDAYNNLGAAFCSMGEYNRAIKYFNRSLDIRLKSFNQDHPSISDTYSNIGTAFGSMGEYKKAIQYYDMSLKMKLKSLNSDHPSIGDIYNNLGNFYGLMSYYDKAIEYFNKSLEIKLKSFNHDHPAIGDTYNNLGNIFFSKREYIKAMDYYNISLKIKLKSLNSDHASIADIYNNLGNIYYSIGNFNKATEYYIMSLEIKLKSFNHDHPSFGDTYYNLGNIFFSNKEYNKAIEFMHKSIEIKLKSFNHDHPSIVNTYFVLGLVYISKGEYDNAIKYFEMFITKRLKSFNHDHPTLDDTYINLGVAYNLKGEYDKAIDYYNKSLEIKLKSFNHDHPSIGDTYNNLGAVYNSKREYDKAIDYYNKSLEIKLKSFNHDHPSIGTIYHSLGLIYNSKGENDKAMEYFNKSKQI